MHESILITFANRWRTCSMRIEAAIKLKVTVATAHVGITSSVLLSSSAIFSLSITRVFFGCLEVLIRTFTWNDANDFGISSWMILEWKQWSKGVKVDSKFNYASTGVLEGGLSGFNMMCFMETTWQFHFVRICIWNSSLQTNYIFPLSIIYRSKKIPT